MSDRPVPDWVDEMDRAEHWNRLHREEQRLERERYGPAPLLHCSLCFKPVAAMADCAACGDATDVERTGGGARETFGTPGIRQDGDADSGPSAERPPRKQAA